MSDQPHFSLYLSVMERASQRFKIIDELSQSPASPVTAELVALQARKIIENVAFGCVICAQTTVGSLPRQIDKEWKASDIIRVLERSNLLYFPRPVSVNFSKTLHSFDYIPEPYMKPADLVAVYRACGKLLHEPFPLKAKNMLVAQEDYTGLQQSVFGLSKLLGVHVTMMMGEAYLCSLWDGAAKQAALIHLKARG